MIGYNLLMNFNQHIVKYVQELVAAHYDVTIK